jgi:hemoglobin-like flavoprotein
MALTPQQKRHIYMTMPKLMINDDLTADLFYVHLFVKLPQTEAMFRRDNMPEQRRKFMLMLSRAVNLLDASPQFQREMRDLAVRHITEYGVTSEMFAQSEEIMISAIAHSLKNDFTPEVEDAWRALYQMIAAVFTQADNAT